MKRLLFGTILVLVLSAFPNMAMAQVQVGISIGVPHPSHLQHHQNLW